MKKMHLMVAPLAATVLLLAGCGTDDEPGTNVDSSAEFNDADVAFATDMIPHHAQALLMVDMTTGKDLDPQLVALTEQIRTAQSPEIETMSGWLTDWDQPVPETARDHANAHSDMDMGDSDMPGMMSGEELDELEAASGSAFETMWIEMMIEHHEGAIEMAAAEIEDGKFPDAITLAGEIVEGQTAEIEQMEKLAQRL